MKSKFLFILNASLLLIMSSMMVFPITIYTATHDSFQVNEPITLSPISETFSIYPGESAMLSFNATNLSSAQIPLTAQVTITPIENVTATLNGLNDRGQLVLNPGVNIIHVTVFACTCQVPDRFTVSIALER